MGTLNDVLTAKSNIKTAIENKGVNMDNIPFTEYANQINKINTMPDGLEEKVNNNTKNIISLEKKIPSLDPIRESISNIEIEIDNLQDLINNRINSSITNNTNLINNIKNVKIPDLNSRLSDLNSRLLLLENNISDYDIGLMYQSINELQNAISNLRSSFESLNIDSSTLSSLNTEILNLKEKLKDLNNLNLKLNDLKSKLENHFQGGHLHQWLLSTLWGQWCFENTEINYGTSKFEIKKRGDEDAIGFLVVNLGDQDYSSLYLVCPYGSLELNYIGETTNTHLQSTPELVPTTRVNCRDWDWNIQGYKKLPKNYHDFTSANIATAFVPSGHNWYLREIINHAISHVFSSSTAYLDTAGRPIAKSIDTLNTSINNINQSIMDHTLSATSHVGILAKCAPIIFKNKEEITLFTDVNNYRTYRYMCPIVDGIESHTYPIIERRYIKDGTWVNFKEGWYDIPCAITPAWWAGADQIKIVESGNEPDVKYNPSGDGSVRTCVFDGITYYIYESRGLISTNGHHCWAPTFTPPDNLRLDTLNKDDPEEYNKRRWELDRTLIHYVLSQVLWSRQSVMDSAGNNIAESFKNQKQNLNDHAMNPASHVGILVKNTPVIFKNNEKIKLLHKHYPGIYRTYTYICPDDSNGKETLTYPIIVRKWIKNETHNGWYDLPCAITPAWYEKAAEVKVVESGNDSDVNYSPNGDGWRFEKFFDGIKYYIYFPRGIVSTNSGYSVCPIYKLSPDYEFDQDVINEAIIKTVLSSSMFSRYSVLDSRGNNIAESFIRGSATPFTIHHPCSFNVVNGPLDSDAYVYCFGELPSNGHETRGVLRIRMIPPDEIGNDAPERKPLQNFHWTSEYGIQLSMFIPRGMKFIVYSDVRVVDAVCGYYTRC